MKWNKPAMRQFLIISLSIIINHLPHMLMAESNNTIEAVNRYLNGITSLVADFTQTAPDGSLGYGRFFLKRPGKFRWQYEPPIPLLIIGNGKNMTYVDFELDQVSHMPTRDNLASLLAKQQINLHQDARILNIDESRGAIRIQVADKDLAAEGSLTMVFATSPLSLQRLEILDAANRQTIISLSNHQYSNPLEDRLFIHDATRRSLKRLER